MLKRWGSYPLITRQLAMVFQWLLFFNIPQKDVFERLRAMVFARAKLLDPFICRFIFGKVVAINEGLLAIVRFVAFFLFLLSD